MGINQEIIKEIFGWTVVVLTASQFFPQIYKVFRTKSTKDLSWWTFIQTFVISVLWTFYGFWHGAVEIIVTNILVNISCNAILMQKYFNEKPKIRLVNPSFKTKLLVALIGVLGIFVITAIIIPSPLLRGILGWFTVFLNVTQFMPQAFKSFKTKSTRDLSWWTFIQISVLTLLWVLYGVWNGSIEVVVTNSIVHVVCDAILVRKYLGERSG